MNLIIWRIVGVRNVKVHALEICIMQKDLSLNNRGWKYIGNINKN